VKTQAISDYTGKGQHSTSTATLYRLSFGGSVIDTPGIRELGLWDFDPQELHLFFREFKEFSVDCKYYNCTHRHEPGCKLRRAVDLGKIAEFRYKNYLYMLDELDEKSQNTKK
ncbi:MAG: ribosome small subunit-dependent GTPase A, partial [Calditrichaeota bacterium]|nr:ribosome small subunit-dependent GTPase A [Calditrichota bacterium]